MNKIEVKDGKVYINEVEIENVERFTMEPNIEMIGTDSVVVSYNVNIDFRTR